jgi:two-component system, chemotaxis family, sensor kinase CheA
MDKTWLSEVPEKKRRAVYTELVEGGIPAWLVCYTPGDDAFARILDPVRLARELPGLRWSDLDARREASDSPENGDNTCRLVLRVIAAEHDPALSEDLAAQGERVTITRLAPSDLCFPVGEMQAEAGWEHETETRDFIKRKQGLALWRVCADRLKEIGDGSWQASALRWMLCVLENQRPDQMLLEALVGALVSGTYEAPVTLAEAPTLPTTSKSPSLAADLQSHVVLLLHAQIEMLTPEDPDFLWPGRLHAAATALRRIFSAAGAEDLAKKVAPSKEADLLAHSEAQLVKLAQEGLLRWQVEPVEATKAASAEPDRPSALPAPAPPRNDEIEHQALRLLKVEPARIDALLGLVGELVVAKNSLPFLARRAEEEFGSRQLAREIKERYAVVNRIAEELQSAVMRVRMMPLAQVFRRFPRLVRDLSAKLGKSIRLDILGEETEADKGIVEELFDPLVHLFRNSIDHGLEMPDEREARGKAREGLICLSAQHADDHVIIELRDDGQGIDVERVRQKAAEKGLASLEDLQQRSDDDIIQLIFAPGFSTVDSVSELSGRGVGMDVVRTMVTRAGGTITVTSKREEGTITRITLPVTMAVSRVMIIEVGGTEVGIPFANITETVRVQYGDLKHVGQGRAIVLRGRMVPVWSLAEVLALPKVEARAENGVAILVMRADGHELGFAVDGFQDTVDVITKPLAGVLGQLNLFSGTAMLGDGRVLLVLDPKELVRCL